MTMTESNFIQLSDELGLVQLKNRSFYVKLFKIKSMRQYVGDIARRVSPIEQFYLDALQVVTRVHGQGIYINKSKVFISEKNFNVLFYLVVDYIVRLTNLDRNKAMIEAGKLFRDMGPTLADFAPDTHVLAELDYLFILNNEQKSEIEH
jgi:hypothetical protein